MPLISLALAAAIQANTAIAGTAIFVDGLKPADGTTITAKTLAGEVAYTFDPSIKVPGFAVFNPGLALGTLDGTTSVTVKAEISEKTCAYIAPIESKDPAADAIVATSACPANP